MTDEFDDKRLDQIDTAAIYEYEKRRRKSVSPATIGFELRVLSVLYGLCDAWGWHDKNPVQSYKRRAKVARRDISSRNERNRYLTHDEERALLLAAPEAWKWRIVFAIETGLRKEEQFGLPWSQVDLKAKHLRITAEMAKNGKERFVPLTARAIQAATQMRVKGSEWVCPRPDGERFAWNSPNIWRGLQAIAETANINNLNWHDLRRTCGCRLLQDRELSMEAVQRWLGHASITTTERVYAFLKVDNLKRMIERTEKLALSNKDEGYR
jgi:integrase